MELNESSSNTNLNNSSSNDQDYSECKQFQNGFMSRHFEVLDEISEDKNSGSDYSDDSDMYDSEVPDEEIEAMLEEGLPEEFRARKRRKLDDKSGRYYKIGRYGKNLIS